MSYTLWQQLSIQTASKRALYRGVPSLQALLWKEKGLQRGVNNLWLSLAQGEALAVACYDDAIVVQKGQVVSE